MEIETAFFESITHAINYGIVIGIIVGVFWKVVAPIK